MYIKTAMATGIMLLVAKPIVAAGNQSVIDGDYHENVLKFHASQSTNASFLTEMRCPNLSYLELNGHVRKGDMVNYYQSNDSRDFSARAGSHYRFNERLMLTGTISYGFDKGENMSGSAFINPEYTPFDIVEMDASDAGTKRREMYLLSGNAGYSLNNKISIGASFAYEIENYAKFKDLRHQNTMMTLDLSLGGKYNVSDNVDVGVAYIYKRNIQRISFDIYGNTDRQYTSLISFGGFFGRSELFGESGYTSNPLPLFTNVNGLALQLSFDIAGVRWFNEFGYYNGSGQYGTGSATSITYSHHNSVKWGYKSKFLIAKPSISHVIELSAFIESLENHEGSYKESTDADGVSQIVYYGSNKVGDKDWKGANVSYSIISGYSAKRYDWCAGIEAGYHSRLTTASQYPFYRKQEINTVWFEAFATKNWCRKKDVFTLSCRETYSTGWGVMNEDGTYTSTSENQKKPAVMDDLLRLEYDYNVAGQVKSCVSVGYERAINDKLSLYSSVGFSYLIALNTSMKRCDYKVLELSIGAKF